jgi:hypothetical protein
MEKATAPVPNVGGHGEKSARQRHFVNTQKSTFSARKLQAKLDSEARMIETVLNKDQINMKGEDEMPQLASPFSSSKEIDGLASPNEKRLLLAREFTRSPVSAADVRELSQRRMRAMTNSGEWSKAQGPPVTILDRELYNTATVVHSCNDGIDAGVFPSTSTGAAEVNPYAMFKNGLSADLSTGDFAGIDGTLAAQANADVHMNHPTIDPSLPCSTAGTSHDDLDHGHMMMRNVADLIRHRQESSEALALAEGAATSSSEANASAPRIVLLGHRAVTAQALAAMETKVIFTRARTVSDLSDDDGMVTPTATPPAPSPPPVHGGQGEPSQRPLCSVAVFDVGITHYSPTPRAFSTGVLVRTSLQRGRASNDGDDDGDVSARTAHVETFLSVKDLRALAARAAVEDGPTETSAQSTAPVCVGSGIEAAPTLMSVAVALRHVHCRERQSGLYDCIQRKLSDGEIALLLDIIFTRISISVAGNGADGFRDYDDDGGGGGSDGDDDDFRQAGLQVGFR